MASSDSDQSQLSLHDAASAGVIDRVVRLLDDGVAVDMRDDFGSTALHRAVMSGHSDIVRLLLQRGVPVDARNVRGSTALAMAGSVEVIELLLDAGADPNADIGGGLTPFQYLARTAAPNVRRFLKARMGIAPSPVDLLRDEMKTLAEKAAATEFKAVTHAANGVSRGILRLRQSAARWSRRVGDHEQREQDEGHHPDLGLFAGVRGN
jgi:Ankyrin repeats (3 copies)